MLNRAKLRIMEVLAFMFDTTSDSRIWEVRIAQERVDGAFPLSESITGVTESTKATGKDGEGKEGALKDVVEG